MGRWIVPTLKEIREMDLEILRERKDFSRYGSATGGFLRHMWWGERASMFGPVKTLCDLDLRPSNWRGGSYTRGHCRVCARREEAINERLGEEVDSADAQRD